MDVFEKYQMLSRYRFVCGFSGNSHEGSDHQHSNIAKTEEIKRRYGNNNRKVRTVGRTHPSSCT